MAHRILIILFLAVPFLQVFSMRTVHGRVTRVVDGDTYRITLDTGQRIKVRLLGVDTPESYRTRYGYREYLGKTVSLYVRRLLRGRRITLLVLPNRHGQYRRGRYGRVLAYVETDGRDLGALLLRKGYGGVYRKKPCSRHGRYHALERQAKQRQRGIWNRSGARIYYRTLYRRTRNDRLILYFWRNDRAFLRRLLG